MTVRVTLKTKYFKHPGGTAFEVIERARSSDFWGAKLLNVNLPVKQTKKMKFTRQAPDLKKLYAYPIGIDRTKGEYWYPSAYADDLEDDVQYDFAAVKAGYITITPSVVDITDESVIKKMMGKDLLV